MANKCVERYNWLIEAMLSHRNSSLSHQQVEIGYVSSTQNTVQTAAILVGMQMTEGLEDGGSMSALPPPHLELNL